MNADWEQREGFPRRVRQLWWVMDMFKVLNVVMGSQVYMHAKIHPIYTFMGSLLYVNTSIKLSPPSPPKKDSALRGKPFYRIMFLLVWDKSRCLELHTSFGDMEESHVPRMMGEEKG